MTSRGINTDSKRDVSDTGMVDVVAG